MVSLMVVAGAWQWSLSVVLYAYATGMLVTGGLCLAEVRRVSRTDTRPWYHHWGLGLLASLLIGVLWPLKLYQDWYLHRLGEDVPEPPSEPALSRTDPTAGPGPAR